MRLHLSLRALVGVLVLGVAAPLRFAPRGLRRGSPLFQELNINASPDGGSDRAESIRKKIELLKKSGRDYNQAMTTKTTVAPSRVPEVRSLEEEQAEPEERAASATNATEDKFASFASLNKEAPAPTKRRQSTSGVGGSWAGEAAKGGVAPDGQHKPKVATWGVFERPADISKAYGGGRKVGIGGFQSSPEEQEKRAAATREALDAFRKGRSSAKAKVDMQDSTTWGSKGADLGGDGDLEDANAKRIDAAVETARLSVSAGDYSGAAAALDGVLSLCTYRTPRGGSAWLQLAAVREAEGRRADAERIYTELKKFTMDRKVLQKARALAFGKEAADWLRLDTEAERAKEVAAMNELRKTVLKVGQYNVDRSFSPTASARTDLARMEGNVTSLPEARAVLLLAASARGEELVAQSRVAAALDLALEEWRGRVTRASASTDGVEALGDVFRAGFWKQEGDSASDDAGTWLRALLRGTWTTGICAGLEGRSGAEVWEKTPRAPRYNLNDLNAQLTLEDPEGDETADPQITRLTAAWDPPLLFGLRGDTVRISGALETASPADQRLSWESAPPAAWSPFGGGAQLPEIFTRTIPVGLRVAYVDDRLLLLHTATELLTFTRPGRPQALGDDDGDSGSEGGSADDAAALSRRKGMSSAELWRKALGEW